MFYLIFSKASAVKAIDMIIHALKSFFKTLKSEEEKTRGNYSAAEARRGKKTSAR